MPVLPGPTVRLVLTEIYQSSNITFHNSEMNQV